MNNIKNYGLLMLSVFFMSASAIFVKLSSAPSAVTAFYRLFITSCILLPCLLISKEKLAEYKSLTKKQLGIIVVSGLLIAVHYVMWFESLRFTSVSSSTVLVSLQPLYSMLFGYIFLKEKVSGVGLFGCLLAILGVVVIAWGDFKISDEAFFGDILSLASAGVISAYFLIGQIVRKHVTAVTYSVPCYFASSFFLALYAITLGQPMLGFDTQTWFAFVGIAIVSTIGGQFILNLLLKDLSATSVTTGILGEPVGTIILAFFILGETISLRQLAGIILIMGGLGIYFFYPILKGKK
ncbi:MAG: DMT family transporter [Phascolarctobacterium sp.]|nr:DMT family transporter [Phascolarctobacterium sp.]